MDFLGRFARGVRGAACLALARSCLHVVVLFGEWSHIVIAVPESGHRGNSSGESTDRMEWSLEGEFIVRDLVRIAPSHAGLYADNVPAGASLFWKGREIGYAIEWRLNLDSLLCCPFALPDTCTSSYDIPIAPHPRPLLPRRRVIAQRNRRLTGQTLKSIFRGFCGWRRDLKG